MLVLILLYSGKVQRHFKTKMKKFNEFLRKLLDFEIKCIPSGGKCIPSGGETKELNKIEIYALLFNCLCFMGKLCYLAAILNLFCSLNNSFFTEKWSIQSTTSIFSVKPVLPKISGHRIPEHVIKMADLRLVVLAN